jgi:signal transduction histidine kinase
MVTDNGIGMNEEDRKNLFKPYFKTTDRTSKQLNKNSYGLGLCICQKIANGLQGTIFVDSMKGKGSTFTFQFIADKVLELKEEHVVLERRGKQKLIPETPGYRG